MKTIRYERCEGRGGGGGGVVGWERRVSSQAASHSDSEERRRGRLKFVKMQLRVYTAEKAFVVFSGAEN